MAGAAGILIAMLVTTAELAGTTTGSRRGSWLTAQGQAAMM
jgi:hypothetical protein